MHADMINTMDRYQNNLENIQKSVDWLGKNIKHNEEEIQQKSADLLKKHSDSFLIAYNIEQLKLRSKIKCNPNDFISIYALSFLNDQIVENFLKCADNKDFWNDTFIERFQSTEDFYFWNFLYEMGFSSNKYFLRFFESFKKDVTVEGRFWNDGDHVCFLRLAIALEPHSPNTKKVLKYCLENDFHLLSPFESSVFILALTELDFFKYKEIIEEGINFIKSKQNDDGSLSERKMSTYSSAKDVYLETYFAIRAICRVNGNNDVQLKRGIEFISKNQQLDGTWGYFNKKKDESIYCPDKEMTSIALMSLILFSPPLSVSLEEYMFKDNLLKQKINSQKPYFIHTSPIYNANIHVKEILDKIQMGFSNANHTIRIISPYIDMLYEDITNLKNRNPSLIVKIITRPKRDINGMRERIGKNAFDLLKIATSGNLKTLNIIHSRLIIIDDQELIITSADLTREGLFDEFNAGIYTNDKEAIKDSVDYFENIWEIIQEKEGANR